MGQFSAQQKLLSTLTLLYRIKYTLTMSAVIVLFVFQIFLFGFTSADCPEPCNECKEFSSGPYQGIWSLIERNSSSCPSMCLYQDVDNATRQMCFCDPGTESYTPCGVSASNEYLVRKGDCPGNDIYHLTTTLADCTQLCNDMSNCKAFMFFNHTVCFLKTKSCNPTDTTNPLNVFYSKTEWEGGLCYNDTAQPKLYSYSTVLVDNSVENCRNHCSNQTENYTYIGLESTNLDGGDICYCGNTEPPTATHQIVDPSNCWVNCPGNSSETCGAFNFINVWTVIPIHV